MRAMSLTQSQTYSKEAKAASSDSLLVAEAKKNMRAFEKLYDKYYEAIFRFIYQRVTTQEEAFDITSQTFMKAMESLSKYEDRGLPFSSWLYRIAKSEVYQYHRDNQKLPPLNVDDNQLNQLSEEVNENDTIINNEEIIEILSSLSDDELPFIEMKYLEDRSYREIGEIMNMTENNAKVKTHRILTKIKKNFKK